MAFVFPSHCYAWWSPAVLEMAEHLPTNGKQRINSLFCFDHTHSFALLIKSSSFQPTLFHTFTLPILSPIPTQGEWASGWVGLGCLPRLNYNTDYPFSFDILHLASLDVKRTLGHMTRLTSSSTVLPYCSSKWREERPQWNISWFSRGPVIRGKGTSKGTLTQCNCKVHQPEKDKGIG